MQDQVKATPAPKRVPWNKGKLTGGKAAPSTQARLVGFSFVEPLRDLPCTRLRRHPRPGWRRHHTHEACCRLPD
jgi:hypothetical protein